jgi:hypothetical protein
MATDPPQPTDARAQVVLSYASLDPHAGVVSGAGYVTPVIEDGGTCVLVLTKGSSTVTATSTGKADAATTDCGNLEVPRSRLSAGTWQAALKYSSAAAHGMSAKLTVEIGA